MLHQKKASRQLREDGWSGSPPRAASPRGRSRDNGGTKRNNPWLLRAAVTRANVKGILVCGNIGRRGSSGWRRPPHSGAGSGTSPWDSRLHIHLISPCTHKMCSDCVCSPSLRFRYSTHGDSSCCLRAAPRRPRQARRRARARAPAPRGARVGGSRRLTQAGCRALWCFSSSSVAGRGRRGAARRQQEESPPCVLYLQSSGRQTTDSQTQHHSRHACTRTARGQIAGRSRVPRSTDLTSERSPPCRPAGSSWPYRKNIPVTISTHACRRSTRDEGSSAVVTGSHVFDMEGLG